MQIQNIKDVHHFLDSIPTFKAEGVGAADFSLNRFEKFCAAIGDPQDKFQSVHVAGSNGKGSTCQILASIYGKANYKVGLYTSPHIKSYEERFMIDGIPISEQALVEFFSQHYTQLKSFRLTYFEISTAVAFWWFAQEQVDIAIIETGLGGRLDATNVIIPIAAVITTITLDHTDLLGDTIEEIAAEKAGIIKERVPVVAGNIPDEAEQVIQQVAEYKNATLCRSTEYNPEYRNGKYRLTINGKQIELKSTLSVPVQAYNIAAAWKVTEILNDILPVTEQNRRAGVREVGKMYPGLARFEKLHPDLEWYFDGAHNLQAVQEMKKMIQKIQPVEETILVLSVMRDKLNEKMISEFSEFKKIIYHTLPLGRAATLNNIQQWLPSVHSFPESESSRNTLLKELESELVIFAGSFYFYTTVRDWLLSLQIDR